MTDRPILFSAPMVRALLAGTKTQTRRLIKPQPTVRENGSWSWEGRNGGFVGSAGTHLEAFAESARHWARIQPSDRLWVREAWRCNGWATDVATIFYAASEGDGYTAMCEQYPVADRRPLRVTAGWRPSIHMPRWASRLSLTVTDVRVERLQSISEDDAKAEGVVPYHVRASGLDYYGPDHAMCGQDHRAGFCQIWEKINGIESWNANPWVVAYSFSVQHSNIDQFAKVAA